MGLSAASFLSCLSSLWALGGAGRDTPACSLFLELYGMQQSCRHQMLAPCSKGVGTSLHPPLGKQREDWPQLMCHWFAQNSRHREAPEGKKGFPCLRGWTRGRKDTEQGLHASSFCLGCIQQDLGNRRSHMQTQTWLVELNWEREDVVFLPPGCTACCWGQRPCLGAPGYLEKVWGFFTGQAMETALCRQHNI